MKTYFNTKPFETRLRYLVAGVLPAFFCLLVVSSCFGQYVQVDSIYILGNKRTKDRVVLRELDFRQGDSLLFADLTSRMERNELLLLNTRLFNDAKLNIINIREDKIDVRVELREAWYIYPLLIFELADRNFNVWWVEQNRALDRINFGVRFYYENFTGRNDRLKVVTQFGYTQKYELEYRLPWFNKGQSLGMSFNGLHTRNREVAYQTNDTTNRQDFLRLDDQIGLKRGRAGFKMIYRPKLLGTHEWGMSYHHNIIADTITQLNPTFFLDNRVKQQFLSLEYSFTLDRRDRRSYALSGNYFQVHLKKDGLGLFGVVNNLSLTGSFGQYWRAGKKFSFEVLARGRKNLITDRQPYYTQRRALGFSENFVRGYEFYVIDGQDFTYLKTGIRFELIHKDLNGSKVIPLKAMKIIPFRVYLKLNNDLGYVNDPFSTAIEPLSNSILWGGGLGLDMVLYHNFVFQLEYSINRLNEKGVYLHFNVPF
ncbi:MAG: BamA/TamA family outer membrane protein [Bacteroidota bacterium]